MVLSYPIYLCGASLQLLHPRAPPPLVSLSLRGDRDGMVSGASAVGDAFESHVGMQVGGGLRARGAGGETRLASPGACRRREIAGRDEVAASWVQVMNST